MDVVYFGVIGKSKINIYNIGIKSLILNLTIAFV